MDIRNFFQSNEVECKAARPNSKKRPQELPIKAAYEGFFQKGQPKPLEEPMVQPRKKKRAKVEAIKPFQKFHSKLAIIQWHFAQAAPNCVVTANRFFPNEPAKVRTIQNQAKKGLEFYTQKFADGVRGSRATEGKGGLLPLLDQKMDLIWKELEAKEAPRSDSVLLPLFQEHGFQLYQNFVKLDENNRRYIEKGKMKIRIRESMVRRWRARTTAIRNRTIVNKAVTSKPHHDMAASDFIPLWRS